MVIAEKLIAHVHRNEDGAWAEPHGLLEHLENTARRAEINAAKFRSAAWGKAAGLAHDAGKSRDEWQAYLKRKSNYDEEAHLEGKTGKVPHAIYGAKLVEELFGKAVGRLLAYPIAGHHAGLPDWFSAEGAGRASLQFQQTYVKQLGDIDKSVVELMDSARPPNPPWKFSPGLDIALWIRMLYSSLVDADFLDTESYMNQDKADNRGTYLALTELLIRFNEHMKKLDESSADTKVNAIRREIRRKCIHMAGEEQGIFSLSVPTGGGKTLSSLAFALEHAVKNELDRIIYVIPYTSIIEQNADVFRAAVGEDQVVEHHSNLEEDDSTVKSRLACENWDAPIIVTTSVQFFESLFAAKSSRCRKLHNITRTVVVLDEAQLVPADYLKPILQTMQLLVDHYQVSFVISTATQPAFKERRVGGQLFPGLKNVKEMMGSGQEVDCLYKSLQRTRLEFFADKEPAAWEDIAAQLQQYEQVLCIVSDRKSCRELHSLMPPGTFHLSALMCGQHRSEIIKAIKQKLEKGEAVRVISTQLVEAGVDFDFPVVYRAFAGLDSIAQAAGRCNREGKLPDPGKVVVFTAPRQPPMGILRKAAETTAGIVSSNPEDPLKHEIFEKYFAELYWKVNSLDVKDIVPLLDPWQNDSRECAICFRSAAERFHIVDDSLQKSILVPYGAGAKLINLLKYHGPERGLMRKLQRYTVNIYNDEFNQLLKRGSLSEPGSGIFALLSDIEYSAEIGLMLEVSFDPDKFII